MIESSRSKWRREVRKQNVKIVAANGVTFQVCDRCKAIHLDYSIERLVGCKISVIAKNGSDSFAAPLVT